jgi:hypothetical protein
MVPASDLSRQAVELAVRETIAVVLPSVPADAMAGDKHPRDLGADSVDRVEIILMLMFLPWPGLEWRQARQAKSIVLLITLIGGVALVAVLAAAGMLGRFGGTLFDENFLARVSIYDVFNYVSWNDVLFGMRADDLIVIVKQKLHLPAIESAPVVLVLLLGLPLALLFAVLLGWTIYRLLKGAQLAAWIGTAAFLAAALSNNTLSGKTPVVTIIVVLLAAYAIPASRHAEPIDQAA